MARISRDAAVANERNSTPNDENASNNDPTSDDEQLLQEEQLTSDETSARDLAEDKENNTRGLSDRAGKLPKVKKRPKTYGRNSLQALKASELNARPTTVVNWYMDRFVEYDAETETALAVYANSYINAQQKAEWESRIAYVFRKLPNAPLWYVCWKPETVTRATFHDPAAFDEFVHDYENEPFRKRTKA